MQNGCLAGGDRTAVVADVGRHAIRIGLTDTAGALVHDSVRIYTSTDQPTVSGAISSFAEQAGLARLPRRLAIAVAGVARGDTVSVTNGQWRVSRSGLAAMLQAPPLIVNDFAAIAWAVSSPDCSGRLEALHGVGAQPHGTGTFLILGIGSGLGVAVMSRDTYGTVSITPTEAGNSAFPSGLTVAEPVMAAIGSRHGYATSEMLVSAPGLVAIYTAIAKRGRAEPKTSDAKEVIRLASGGRDPVAGEAVTLFVKALWHLVGNMALNSGAWEGAILTGSLAAALRPQLLRPELASGMALNGAYRRALAAMPRSLITFRNAELEGAAVALLAEDSRRSFAERALAA